MIATVLIGLGLTMIVVSVCGYFIYATEKARLQGQVEGLEWAQRAIDAQVARLQAEQETSRLRALCKEYN